MASTKTTHRIVKTNGISLHIAEAGPATGPLVVLLHGFPEFWYAWRGQIQTLAQAGFHVVAPDQRGYNLSDKPRGATSYGIDALTSDIEGLILALGYQKAFVAGHDWGAMVAWHLAMSAPQMVERLCILNVPHPSVMKHHLKSNPKQIIKSWYTGFFQLPFLPEAFFRAGDFRAGKKALVNTSRKNTFSPTDLDEYTKAWAQPGALTAMINWYRGFFRAPAVRRFSSTINMPTLIIWGAQDAFLGREMAEDSVKRCPQGKLVFFENATHWVQHEEASEVSRLLVEHFADSKKP